MRPRPKRRFVFTGIEPMFDFRHDRLTSGACSSSPSTTLTTTAPTTSFLDDTKSVDLDRNSEIPATVSPARKQWTRSGVVDEPEGYDSAQINVVILLDGVQQIWRFSTVFNVGGGLEEYLPSMSMTPRRTTWIRIHLFTVQIHHSGGDESMNRLRTRPRQFGLASDSDPNEDLRTQCSLIRILPVRLLPLRSIERLRSKSNTNEPIPRSSRNSGDFKI
ncbi:hypothetical protein Drorol1_Dr00000683 [Drosera rotundifolia]